MYFCKEYSNEPAHSTTDCKLLVILVAHNNDGADDRQTLTSPLVLCREFSRIVVVNSVRIVKHHTMEAKFPGASFI